MVYRTCVKANWIMGKIDGSVFLLKSSYAINNSKGIKNPRTGPAYPQLHNGAHQLVNKMEILACDIYSLMTIILCLFAIRVAHVLLCTGKPLKALVPVRTLIILGSGGHTAEMLSLVNILQKDRFFPRFYIAAATDNMSLQKARVLEESLIQQDENSVGKKIDDSNFLQIYRSREVGQSYITSIWTTSIAILQALWLMLKIRPQVVVGIRWSSIFYVESIARVRKFSLSGLLLYKLHLADQIFVQWPKLQSQHPRTRYVGRLM